MGWQRNADSSFPEVKSFSSNRKDYYRILGVDFDASVDTIRINYLRLALKWHPDKHKGEDLATVKFQEINEAYTVLSDPLKRHEYDLRGDFDVQEYSVFGDGNGKPKLNLVKAHFEGIPGSFVLVFTVHGNVKDQALQSCSLK